MGTCSSPSEVASRVYTWDASSDIKVTSRNPGGSPRLLFRPACTHGTRFPTAVGPRGSPPSNTSPRVYTRDGLSDIQAASRRRKAPSPSEFAHRVYTWDEILDTGTSRHPDARTHDAHDRKFIGYEWGQDAPRPALQVRHHRSDPSQRRASSHRPLPSARFRP